jgi:phosphate transport system permease protein
MAESAASMTIGSPPPAAPLPSLFRQPRLWSNDAALHFLARAAAVSILLMLGSLLVVLAVAAAPSIKQFGGKFLVGSDWRPNELEVQKRDAQGHLVTDADGEPVTDKIPPSFGALPVIYGTVVSSLIALVVAIPLSFGAALFLIRIAHHKFAGPISFLIEFLAAIPSIAYGIWGLFVLAPLLQGHVRLGTLEWCASHVPPVAWMVQHLAPGLFEFQSPNGALEISFRGVEPILCSLIHGVPGLSWLFQETITVGGHTIVRDLPTTGRDMFCGGLVLAIMILPIITAISRDVLKSVPRAQLEGTVALGATWWQSSFEMLRFSRSGLFGAVMLGLARAAGETMAVTMVIGNNNQVRASIFAPAQTMSSLLANEFAEASTTIHRAALTEVALILLVLSLIFNVVARYLVVGRGARTAAAH